MLYKNKANKRECNHSYYLAARARFLADGGGCEMQELEELPCDECTAKEL